MQVERRADGWWIAGIPDSIQENGPYTTKADAEEDRRGLDRFFRENPTEPTTTRPAGQGKLFE